jgi:hypothetical protein
VDDRLVGRFAPEQGMVNGRVEPFLLDSKPGRRIALWVEVDEEGGAPGERQAGGQIRRRRRLALRRPSGATPPF